MIRLSVALLPLMLVAGPALAQSHAGHAPVVRAQAAPLPAGCVRRGAPDADPARTGTPGAPVCPTGSVPARRPASAPAPHSGHAMPGMGTAPAAPPAHPHAGHDMSGMATAPAAPPAHPHAGHDMSGMGMAPAAPPADPHAGHDMSGMGMGMAPAAPPADPHAGHDMSGMSMAPAAPRADPHAGHAMSGMAMPPPVSTSADNPGRPPEDPVPAAASAGPAHAADLLFDTAEMAVARQQLLVENGDVRTTAVIIDRLEATVADGDAAYDWNAQGWSGGDINRFWWKSEGGGSFADGIEDAELQALYSRAVRPFWDMQAGLRQTYRPEGDRTDLVVGVQGLAPHWFEVGAAAFLSNKGELSARVEAEYDQRITNRWILQPRAEINLSATDIPDLEIGSGVTSLQVGARLRYEIRKELAPYVGVEWTRHFGGTADYLAASGQGAEETRILIGLRAWF